MKSGTFAVYFKLEGINFVNQKENTTFSSELRIWGPKSKFHKHLEIKTAQGKPGFPEVLDPRWRWTHFKFERSGWIVIYRTLSWKTFQTKCTQLFSSKSKNNLNLLNGYWNILKLKFKQEKSTYPTVSNVHALFYLEPWCIESYKVTFTLWTCNWTCWLLYTSWRTYYTTLLYRRIYTWISG